MYLLKFEPILKQTLWGGDRIVPYKGLAEGPAHVGESWELSGVRGNESVVANGPWAGTTLPALIAREKGALVGDSVYARFGEEFPLLIKFIDAREDLSIQVHPDDALARRRHGSQGKTEMWYVVDAAPGARLRSGFARRVTPDEYEASVANDTVTQILREYEVRRGDLFFLPAGRVHSIGAGSFIAEIQQTSDITYRIYDFNRKGPDGKTRELHTELAKEAIDYTVLDDYRTRYAPEPNRAVELVSCPYFTTELYELDRPCACDLAALDSFLAVICTDGEARLTADGGEPLAVHAGETVLVPAAVRSLRMEPAPAARLLTSCIR
ncbi:type I phosphomannose isomerase catalytic subunit [uncultured Alistipes sp.]|uniref:type I phosphomannose isomerase catalytic subunit n=1 Tax=uncultured Alistipes sp. TaxID=538949 RepID=UPI0026313203|nr:type I phosphomannose isomerase catalytic subunit [uncultured Alistipes sp.]